MQTSLSMAVLPGAYNISRLMHERFVFLSGIAYFLFACSATALDMDAERAKTLANYIELDLPDGKGPHPLAILMPGCLGWHAHHTKWRDELGELDYATLYIDSFSSNGLKGRATLEREVCSGQRVPGAERAADLLAVLGNTWDRADVLAEQTVLFGWSHGGWTALEFLSAVSSDAKSTEIETANLRAAFLYYPYCGIGLSAAIDLPAQTKTIIFHGNKDAITDPEQCRVLAENLSTAGADIKFVPLQYAGHWFDNHAVRSVYNANATKRARTLVNQKLDSIATE